MNEINRLKDAIIGAVDEIDRIVEEAATAGELELEIREVADRLHKVYHSNLIWEETKSGQEEGVADGYINQSNHK